VCTKTGHENEGNEDRRKKSQHILSTYSTSGSVLSLLTAEAAMAPFHSHFTNEETEAQNI
jgi:hypothetical protein